MHEIRNELEKKDNLRFVSFFNDLGHLLLETSL